MTNFINSSFLLLALLNPFLVIVYLIDPIQKLDQSLFRRALIRAGLITSIVFCCFAILGDAIFSNIFHAEFASFQIFGGVILLLIGLQFFFRGPTAITILRGESKNLAGAIAMPVLIGPGTISASILIGHRHNPLIACAAILTAVITSVVIMFILKLLHDFVRQRREAIIQKYIAIAGRITALYVGTVSIEMIMQGLQTWLEKF